MWEPKRIESGVPELQPGNGILNSPDSCQHCPDCLKGNMRVTLTSLDGSARCLFIEECCVSYGVLTALTDAARLGYNINKGVPALVEPSAGWEYWFDSCEVHLNRETNAKDTNNRNGG